MPVRTVGFLPHGVDLTRQKGTFIMHNWFRRHSLAVWAVAAAVAGSGALHKFLHTATTISGGGRHFG
jgi:hypothetical protein